MRGTTYDKKSIDKQEGNDGWFAAYCIHGVDYCVHISLYPKASIFFVGFLRFFASRANFFTTSHLTFLCALAYNVNELAQ